LGVRLGAQRFVGGLTPSAHPIAKDNLFALQLETLAVYELASRVVDFD